MIPWDWFNPKINETEPYKGVDNWSRTRSLTNQSTDSKQNCSELEDKAHRFSQGLMNSVAISFKLNTRLTWSEQDIHDMFKIRNRTTPFGYLKRTEAQAKLISILAIKSTNKINCWRTWVILNSGTPNLHS